MVPILNEESVDCFIIMLQENEKNGNVGPWTKEKQNDAEKNHEDQEILGKKKADVVKEKDLKVHKHDDDMPELTGDQVLLDEQIYLDLNEPPSDVMEYARRELGETEEVKCQMLQELRDMIYGKSNCPVCLDVDYVDDY